MRNDVEKMNNFQNVRISNKAINLIIFYVFLSFYFSKEISKESNIHFFLLSKILSIFKYQKQHY